jgi:hypothetical protein
MEGSHKKKKNKDVDNTPQQKWTVMLVALRDHFCKQKELLVI